MQKSLKQLGRGCVIVEDPNYSNPLIDKMQFIGSSIIYPATNEDFNEKNLKLHNEKILNLKIKMQTTLNVKTKILDPSIPTPALQYAKDGDAGIDLTATSKSYENDGNVVYGTNRAFEIPEGYVGLLFPRSSNSKKDLLLSNSVGILDSGYRGEVMFKYKSTIWDGSYGYGNSYQIEDRVGQLIILPYPKIQFEEVSELSETERGTGGYGSTGN